MMRRAHAPAIALGLSALYLSLGCSDPSPPPPAPAAKVETPAPAPAAGRTISARTVRDLVVMARGVSLSDDKAAAEAAELGATAAALEAFIDDQLEKGGFRRSIALPLVFGGGVAVKQRHPVPSHSVLRRQTHDETPIYYLRAPCAPADAVDVDPWWAPGEPVKVCPDAWRPEARGDAEGRTCGASMLDPRLSDACGCGPRLMYCARDAKQYQQIRKSLRKEVVDTLAEVVRGDGPIDALFTRNSTIRDRYAEFVYRRARVAAGEDPALLDLSGFGDKPRDTPRHDQVSGQHAGILTTPAMMYSSDALRGVMRNFYMHLWCAEPARSNVTVDAVMKLGKVDLRVGDGWKDLAAMDVCTDCHARLDYGMQFFKGYPSSVNGVDFRPSRSLEGKGPLYGDHIRDRRGEAELTPSGFARLALAQPEFGQCLTRRVVDHVFSGQGTAEDFDAVERAFAQTRNVKRMMKVAMTRFAQRPLGPAPSPSAPLTAAAPPPAGDDALPVTPALRGLLDNHCVECHDAGDRHPFDAETQPRKTLAEMLDLVAFGVMPATPRGMDDSERRRFVDAVVPLLWPPGAERDAARAFFSDAYRAHPVHRFDSAMKLVNGRAGADKRLKLKVVERAIQQSEARLSPGFAAAAGLTGLDACKKKGHSGDALIECLSAATDPARLLVGGTGPTP